MCAIELDTYCRHSVCDNRVTFLKCHTVFRCDMLLCFLMSVAPFNLLNLAVSFRTPGLTFKNCTWCRVCVECFVRISEQTATFALYSINWVVVINVVGSVYCAVRTNSLYTTDCVSSLKKIPLLDGSVVFTIFRIHIDKRFINRINDYFREMF